VRDLPSIDPPVTPPATAPLLRVKINQRLYFIMCQGPGILLTDVLFLGILFWGGTLQGALFSDFRNHPMLTILHYLDAPIGKLQACPTCRSPSPTGSCECALMLLLRTPCSLTDPSRFSHGPWDMVSYAKTSRTGPGQRLVAAVKESVWSTNQYSLSEDISIYIFRLRKAYLRCETRVVGKLPATC